MCLRMKPSNENAPADEAGFVLLGFVCGLFLFVCGVFLFGVFFVCFVLIALKKKEKINGYMLIKHSQTPNYKISNALITMIWAFRAFLDQPQQFNHGSKTNASGRSEWKE